VDGRTEPITWYQPEPDPAVACPLAIYPERCDKNNDGTADGMFVQFDGANIYPYGAGVTVPYTQWAVPGSPQITLSVPAVPIIDVVGQRPGKRTGEVVLTLRVRKPSGSTYVPAAGVGLEPGTDWKNVDREGQRVTDADGIMEIRYWRLARPTTVSITAGGLAAVAATVTLQPKRGVGFRTSQFNPPGKDKRTRKGLNREWISLTNTSGSAISLQRWTVTNDAGKRYRFGRLSLAPGASVTLHTGSGRSTNADRYWGASRHVWANRDTATLRNRSGNVVSKCEWSGDRRDGQKTCLVGV
jgi:hypothetical protein